MVSPTNWQNASPGDLDHALPEVWANDVEAAVTVAREAAPKWAATPLADRITALRACQAAIREKSEPLARRIAEETGKPLTEARGELGAVIAKFDLTIADAVSALMSRPLKTETDI